MTPPADRGLYLHIPFCLRKCHYCDFVISTERSPERRRRVLSALEKEILRAVERVGPLQFHTLYLGGGTPSLLPEEDLRRLFKRVRDAFALSADAEVTCEMNPEDAHPEKLKILRELGVNRVSVGVQSLNDRLLRQMGRPHDAAKALLALRSLQETGFRNVSADLLLRLPKQTVEDVAFSVRRIVSCGVSQVVLYDLDVHEKTVYGLRQKQGRLPLPPEETHRQMFMQAKMILEKSGYLPYEVSSFAKPGFESRHNLIYWRNGEYLGLGPGAFSYLSGIRYRFARTLESYLLKCERGDWEPEESDLISEENRQIETLLTGLRLLQGVEWRAIPRVRSRLEKALPPLAEQGWIERTDHHLRLTSEGSFIAESVISTLVTACLQSEAPSPPDRPVGNGSRPPPTGA